MPACRSAGCCRRHPKACAAPAQANLSSADAERVLRAAAVNDTLLVSHTNAGNVPFALNWCRALRRAGVANYVLIATDGDALARLRVEEAGHVVRWPDSGAAASSRSDAAQLRYRSRGWTRLMFAVPQMVRWVLQLGLGVLWSDTDVVALRDPWPLVRSLASAAPPATLIASVDGRVPADDPHECGASYSVDARWGTSSGGGKLCGGLFYLRAGEPALRFLDAWERLLRAPGAGAKNQPHYNAAVRATGLPLRVLPCDLFPNGFRYADEAWRRAQRRAPVMVHNNWIKGHAAKLERFTRWHIWFGA